MLRRDCSSWIGDLDDAARTWVEHALAESYRPPGERAPLADAPEPAVPHRQRIDVLLVTVVPNEAEAAEIVFSIAQHDPRSRRRDDDRKYHELKLKTQRFGALSLAVTNIGESGNAAAQAALRSMLSFYDPEIVVLAGIAAGRLEAVGLGDLVIPRQVWYTEKGASRPEQFIREAQARPLPRRILRLVTEHRVRNTAFYEMLGAALDRLDDDQMPPKTGRNHRPKCDADASVASSEKLLRDGSLRALASDRGIDRKIKVGDMESWALVQAAGSGQIGEWTGPDAPEWMVIRAVSDYGEVDKDDDWQMFASVCALVGARHFLEVTYEPRRKAKL